MRQLRIAVVVWAVLAIAGAQRDFLNALAINSEVQAVQCNSTNADDQKYYSRIQQTIREKGEFDHYLPKSASCVLPPHNETTFIDLTVHAFCYSVLLFQCKLRQLC